MCLERSVVPTGGNPLNGSFPDECGADQGGFFQKSGDILWADAPSRAIYNQPLVTAFDTPAEIVFEETQQVAVEERADREFILAPQQILGGECRRVIEVDVLKSHGRDEFVEDILRGQRE